MKKIIVCLLLMSTQLMLSQTKPSLIQESDNLDNTTNNSENIRNFGSNKSKNIKTDVKAKITDYLIITKENDTTYLDTTLSIKKEYKFNYLRKDNFELLPFSNLGQTYNSLGYNFKSTRLMPEFGVRAKHFNYLETEDINYYHVPTPLTELFFKTAFKQGQLLDAFFTSNTSKQFNFSIGYKGLRSLGTYQNILSSTGNLRMTASYKTKNNRYIANAHFTSQDILNQENGGLTEESVRFFRAGDEDLLDRARVDVNFQDAEGFFIGKRTYINHHYKILNNRDSLSFNEIKIGHVFQLEDKTYDFKQSLQSDVFGEAKRENFLFDRVKLEELYNELNLSYTNNVIGKVFFNASHTNYNYGYDKILISPTETIPNRLKGDVFAVGAKYFKTINQLNLKAEIGANVSGDFSGNFILAEAHFSLNEDITLKASLNNNTVAPNYNMQFYQSDYNEYNWKNNLNTIKTQQLEFGVLSNKWVNVNLQVTNINDYVYFSKATDSSQIEVFQNPEAIRYLKLQVQKEFKYRNFALDNTIEFQTVDDPNNSINVPEIITRNTLYYSNHVFKKAMFLQTGITFKYFTKYNMDAYSPLLSEFYVQNNEEFGAFPLIDFFVNAKIRQTRIYLKAEHLNSSFTGRDYFSAPGYPYRDFTVRFGLVWDFFL
ncbi:putative porin [Aurantibacter aestuarii]|uniref:Porin n=1 Tax=Aurantibacter aestuarii TaxID=1266046 RepID=A0A2T1N5N5_9FLAO|nr:putative porin [Aurantibacter aestuarii]PSG86577.1 hypothetical protein C7H52_12915 [Aurantibacter aestuarii]